MISSDHLKPGDIGRVKATVETANLSGPSMKHLSIYSNDLVSPVLSVEISLNVMPQEGAQKTAPPVVAVPQNVAPTVAAPVVVAPNGVAPK